jgi:hypothetical protein
MHAIWDVFVFADDLRQISDDVVKESHFVEIHERLVILRGAEFYNQLDQCGILE